MKISDAQLKIQTEKVNAAYRAEMNTPMEMSEEDTIAAQAIRKLVAMSKAKHAGAAAPETSSPAAARPMSKAKQSSAAALETPTPPPPPPSTPTAAAARRAKKPSPRPSSATTTAGPPKQPDRLDSLTDAELRSAFASDLHDNSPAAADDADHADDVVPFKPSPAKKVRVRSFSLTLTDAYAHHTL